MFFPEFYSLVKEGVSSYSVKNDVLAIALKKNEYDYSVQLDDFVIDFDKKGRVVGLEIANASSILRIPKSSLKHLVGGKLHVKTEGNNVHVSLSAASQVGASSVVHSYKTLLITPKSFPSASQLQCKI